MNQKNKKVRVAYHHYIMVFLLTLLLVISISFGWYASNTEANVSGGFGNVEAIDGFLVDDSSIFRYNDANRGEDNQLASPYPVSYDPTDENKNIINDLLPNEVFYLSITISAETPDIRSILINFKDIEADALMDSSGALATNPNSTAGIYSMCDVYRIKLDSIWSSKSYVKQDLDELIASNHLTSSALDTKRFTGGVLGGTDEKPVVFINSLNLFEYSNWDFTECITLTFEVTFDFSLVSSENENLSNSLTSDKYIRFDGILVLSKEEN